MSDNVERMFNPTSLGWLGLTSQRIRGKGKEDPEIIAKFKEIKKIRKSIKKIEENMENWTKQMKKLYQTSKKFGAAVETDAKFVKDAEWNAEILLKDKVALTNVRKKIKKLDDLLAQRKLLKYIRLKGDQAQFKLEKLRKHEQRESYERQSTRYLSIHKEAVQQREDIMSEVLIVIDECLKEVDQFGVAYLVKPQMQTFKMTQFHMFLVCQKLIQGKHEDSHLAELEEHWNVFTNRVAEEMPRNHKGGSLEGSHSFLRQALLQAQGSEEDDESASGSDVEEVPKQVKQMPKPSILDSEEDSEYGGEDISDVVNEIGSDGEVVKTKKKIKSKKIMPNGSDSESDSESEKEEA